MTTVRVTKVKLDDGSYVPIGGLAATELGPAGPEGPAGADGADGADGGPMVIPVQASAPSSPVIGQLWFDSDEVV